MENEAVKRKERSIKILNQHNVPYIEHLPVIETSDQVRIRTKDEIAKRAIACLITIQLACDMSNGPDEESKTFFENLLKKFDVMDCLTEDEKLFFTGEPDQQAIINMVWKYEAYWVLLWALGKVEELSYPSIICDCDFAIKAISECDSYEQFMKNIKLRDINEILDEADLIFRYDWACVDARVKGMEAPQELDAGVVVERHKACNWLIDYNQEDDWDNVSVNT